MLAAILQRTKTLFCISFLTVIQPKQWVKKKDDFPSFFFFLLVLLLLLLSLLFQFLLVFNVHVKALTDMETTYITATLVNPFPHYTWSWLGV